MLLSRGLGGPQRVITFLSWGPTTALAGLEEVHFVFGEIQSKRLQKLQNGAARIISSTSNDVDHSVALHVLGWEPLDIRRKKAKARMMYKTLNNIGPESLTKLFHCKNETTKYNLRNLVAFVCHNHAPIV